jgi:hypothetical protein
MYLEQGGARLRGHLDITIFKQVWQQVVDRHAVLRTAFIWKGISKPVQTVYKRVNVPLRQFDWRDTAKAKVEARLEEYLDQDQSEGFDFSEPPLMRLTLIQIADAEYEFIWTIHHLVHDDWSTSMLLMEVFTQYEALSSGKPVTLNPIRPYRDYISWMKKQDYSKAEEFWRQSLRDFTEPTPLLSETGSSNLSGQEDPYDMEEAFLSATATKSLNLLSRQHHLTLNTFFQGAWALLLSHFSGKRDVSFGVVVSGRPMTLAGAEYMIGPFINTLPMRLTVPADKPLLSWLEEIQLQQVRMREYEQTPLSSIQGCSDVPRGMMLFESIFVFQHAFIDLIGRQVGNLTVEKVRHKGHPNYPLTIRVWPGQKILLDALYDVRRFKSTTIKSLLSSFETLLNIMTQQPEASLSALEKMGEASEKAQRESELANRRESIASKLKNIKPKVVRA